MTEEISQEDVANEFWRGWVIGYLVGMLSGGFLTFVGMVWL